MVIGRAATRYVKQRLVTAAKPRITSYISQEYGQIAGAAAGIALSVSVGDYYGALTGISGKFGDSPPDDRAPPFGYLSEGDGLNGPTHGTFHQTLRPTEYRNNRSRDKYKYKLCKCRKGKRQRRSRRGRRRFK